MPIIYVLPLEEQIKLLTKHVILLFLLYIPRFEIHIELQIHLFLAIILLIHNNKKPIHIKHPKNEVYGCTIINHNLFNTYRSPLRI